MMTKTIQNSLSLGLLLAGISCPLAALADVTEHGGEAQRQYQEDNIPPTCQFDMPRASVTPFAIRWNCSDDNTVPGDIRTELWIYKKGVASGELLKTFLGFPAGAGIDEKTLGVEKFTDGLPISFRLLARDRHGTAMITPFMQVEARENAASTCSIKLVVEATESTGDTVGQPEKTVQIASTEVTLQQLSISAYRVTTASKVTADPCEVDSICSDEDQVSFDANFAISDSSKAEGGITLSPGTTNSTLEGDAVVNEQSLSSVTLEGETTVDGTKAKITLSCSQ